LNGNRLIEITDLIIKEEFMHSNLGKKIVLHRIAFPDLNEREADEFTIVEIVELKDIPDAWREGEIHKDGGWKAKDKDGRFFVCNWGTFPSDSMSPTWSWFEIDENGEYIKQWYDITQGLYGAPGLPPALKDNGVVDYCPKHKIIHEINTGGFLGDGGPDCFQCWLDYKYPEKRKDKEPWKETKGPWQGWK
jgi:hypothetical protein